MSGERPRAGEWRTEGHENSRAYNAWEGRGAQELSSIQRLGDVEYGANSQVQAPLELSVLPLLCLVDTPHHPLCGCTAESLRACHPPLLVGRYSPSLRLQCCNPDILCAPHAPRAPHAPHAPHAPPHAPPHTHPHAPPHAPPHALPHAPRAPPSDGSSPCFLEHLPSVVRSRVLAPLLMNCGEPTIFRSLMLNSFSLQLYCGEPVHSSHSTSCPPMLLLMLLACRVNHEGLYHRVGLPPSHSSCPSPLSITRHVTPRSTLISMGSDIGYWWDQRR